MRQLVSLLVFPLLALAACDSPSPRAASWPNHRTIEQNGMTFGLHWNRKEIEIYRISRRFRPDLTEVRANAILATERATGCTIRPGTLTGDRALLKARLTCR